MDRHLAFESQIEIEHRRQIHEDHVVLGDVEVVHHRGTRDRDRFDLHETTVGRDAQIREVGLERRVAEREKFAGRRTDLRVSGERTLEHSAEVGGADRVQVAVEHVGEVTLFEGQDLSGVTDDVRVGLRTGHVEGDARVEDVDRRVLDERGLHVSIAVPLGPAVTQPNAVDHAVTEEGMIAHPGDRVGAVAQIATVEFGGDRSGDLQFGERALLEDGSTVALQVGGDFFGHRHDDLLMRLSDGYWMTSGERAHMSAASKLRV